MALASANDSNLSRFDARDANLESTEQEFLAAKQLTALRQGGDDGDSNCINDNRRIGAQNPSLWPDYQQAPPPPSHRFADETEMIKKDCDSRREASHYDQQFHVRVESRRSKKDKIKFSLATVDSYTSNEQPPVNYATRSSKGQFNFKRIDPSELQPSSKSAQSMQDDSMQDGPKRDTSIVSADGTVDASSKKISSQPNENRQIIQNINKSLKGQDHVNGHTTGHRMKKSHDNQTEIMYVDDRRTVRKQMDGLRRDNKDVMDEAASDYGNTTVDAKIRGINRSTEKLDKSYSSMNRADKQLESTLDQMTNSPSSVENIPATGLTSSIPTVTSFAGTAYQSSHMKMFTSVGGSAVTPQIPIVDPSNCFRDDTLRSVSISHGGNERPVVEAIPPAYRALHGSHPMHPLYISAPPISSYSTASAYPSTFTTSGVQAWPHAVDAMYYHLPFQHQHPVSSMPPSNTESRGGPAILRRQVNNNVNTTGSNVSTSSNTSATNSIASSKVTVVTTTSSGTIPDATAIALSVVPSVVASSQIDSAGPLTASSSSWAPILPAPGRYSPSVVVNTQVFCPVCERPFKSTRSLNGHMRLHGGFEKNRVQNEEESRKRKADKSIPSVDLRQNLFSGPERERDSGGSDYDTVKQASIEMKDSDGTNDQFISSNLSDGFSSSQHQKVKPRPAPLVFNNNINQSDSSGRSSRLRMRLDAGLNSSANSGASTPPAYTPPPMLTPSRKGSYLFSPTLLHPSSSGGASQLRRRASISVDSDESYSSDDDGEKLVPKINVGENFQAEVPDLVGNKTDTIKEADHADRVFICSNDLTREQDDEVERYLEFACSDGVAFGGRNKEFALHCLYKADGDIKQALRILLQIEAWCNERNTVLQSYNYNGNSYWNEDEKKAFYEAYREHQKDFYAIQKAVGTKNVEQCVEYYYLWKKQYPVQYRRRIPYEPEPSGPRRVRRTHAHRSVSISPEARKASGTSKGDKEKNSSSGLFVCNIGGCTSSFTSKQALNGHIRVHGGRLVANHGKLTDSPANKAKKMKVVHRREDGPQGNKKHKTSSKHQAIHKSQQNVNEPTSFICKVCGREFAKLKSRSAHMKTHKRADDDSKQRPKD